MITRRSFLWQMFGAGLWAAIARWFRGEPTVEPPKEELRDIGEPIEWPARGERTWQPTTKELSTLAVCPDCHWWWTCDHLNCETLEKWETFKFREDGLKLLADIGNPPVWTGRIDENGELHLVELM